MATALTVARTLRHPHALIERDLFASRPFTGASAALCASFIGGISAGRVQAPLFAAAGTLPPDRATTGSAVLMMARQIGSAIGVAVVVVIGGPAAAHPVTAFHHVWLAEIIAGLTACLAVAATAGRPTA